uniref:Uncharacterized protein n=1 Tax=Oryza rufipogon TaxID=4529 RepID=A0A0E0MVG7_ORYRU
MGNQQQRLVHTCQTSYAAFSRKMEHKYVRVEEEAAVGEALDGGGGGEEGAELVAVEDRGEAAGGAAGEQHMLGGGHADVEQTGGRNKNVHRVFTRNKELERRICMRVGADRDSDVSPAGACIDHFCACGYLDGGSKRNGRQRRQREPDAAIVFAPPLGYRPRQQLHFRRQASGGWGEKAGAARRCRGSAGQRRREWRHSMTDRKLKSNLAASDWRYYRWRHKGFVLDAQHLSHLERCTPHPAQRQGDTLSILI